MIKIKIQIYVILDGGVRERLNKQQNITLFLLPSVSAQKILIFSSVVVRKAIDESESEYKL